MQNPPDSNSPATDASDSSPIAPGPPAAVFQALEALELTITPEVMQTLATYLDRLLEANKQFNLTGIKDRDEAWMRHIVDSLTLLPGLDVFEDGGRIIDIGSGGGLPGIPLAIAAPHLRFTLLEVTGKKAAFLRETVKAMELNHVTVIQDRAEELGQDPDHRQHYDAAVCRAVGPLRVLLEYAMPFVRIGGKLMAMKGPSVEAELAVAGDALSVLGAGDLQVFEAYPPELENQTVIVSIVKDRATPKMYPRRTGTPKQEPI